MALNWKLVGSEIKKRREQINMTQDLLAAKIGVRWNTIARIEIGIRKPSLPLLEKIGNVLNCKMADLLIEKEGIEMERVELEREPSLKGVPNFFRFCVRDAASRKWIGRSKEAGGNSRSDYSEPGYHLAIHAGEYLTEEAEEELTGLQEQIWEKKGIEIEELKQILLEFFDREFPGCMALIPRQRRNQFIKGVLRARDDDRLPGLSGI